MYANAFLLGTSEGFQWEISAFYVKFFLLLEARQLQISMY
jgi:hypothetical protein